jgi:hypothetical protein
VVICPTRVRIENAGGEKFEEAQRGALAGSGDERW